MPGFMPDIHGFFGFVPSMTEESAAFQLSFRVRRVSAGPGIQMQARSLFLDSGFAAFDRAPE